MSLQNPNNNFPLDTMWDYTQVDFVNPTLSDVTIDIFNSITISNFATSGSGFYIYSPYNYNSLLQDIQNNPMMLRRMELIVQNQSQFNQPFTILKRDANGNQCQFPRLPNTELSVNQFQPNIASLDFVKNEFILDDNTLFSQYTFPANSLTRMLIFYKQIKRIEMLSGQVIFKELESTLGLIDVKISEAQLRLMSTEPILLGLQKKEVQKTKRLILKEKYLKKIE